MKGRYLLLVTGCAALVAGCTLAPKYHRPASPIPAQWPGAEAYAQAGAPANAPAAPDIAWQDFFADQNLQCVIGSAITNNRDLRIAALNVDRARAIYGIQRGELLPSVRALGSGSKQETPADLSSTGARHTSERYDVSLGVAAWEIDFFGRIQSLKDRALEEYLATEQARRSAQILLVSSVANAYLLLAADRENLALAETTLASQQGAYDLIKRRCDLGLAPYVDVYRSRTQVETARGDVAQFRQRVALDENALDLLVGTPVASRLLPTALTNVVPPREVAPGIASDALLRRPDILQAEALLKAANADIGAARATLFPRISLTAAYGTASSELSGLFKSDQDAWSFIPLVSMPIFDTRTWSALEATKVQQKIIVTQYEKTIQNAFKEVADALAVRDTVGQQVAAQEALVEAVDQTYRMSTSRYDKGMDSYLSVLDAQRSLYTAQRGLVLLRLAKTANTVRLYSVLGGGWSDAAAATEP